MAKKRIDKYKEILDFLVYESRTCEDKGVAAIVLMAAKNMNEAINYLNASQPEIREKKL